MTTPFGSTEVEPTASYDIEYRDAHVRAVFDCPDLADRLEDVAPDRAPEVTTRPEGLLPRGYATPECRTGADRWPDLHEMCHWPGYEDRVLGWVQVPCVCTCHQQSDGHEQEAGP